MRNIAKKMKLAVSGLLVAGGLSVSGLAADILIIDEERVIRESAAYKDFSLQTAKIRESIQTLQRRGARDGFWDQAIIQFQARVQDEFKDLEDRKAIIGNDQFEAQRVEKETAFQQERVQLQQQAQAELQNLRQLELLMENLRQEAQVQLDRARAPLLNAILKEREATIIMRKSLVLETASGLDVTTEFIERLDDALPTVQLTLLEAVENAQQQQSQQAATPEGGSE